MEAARTDPTPVVVPAIVIAEAARAPEPAAGETAAPEVEVPAEEEVAAEAPPQEEAEAPAPQEEAETPAPDPWVEQEPVPPLGRRWYVRLAKVLAVVAVAVGALRVIPHHLYVTERCVLVPLERAHVRSLSEGILREIFVDEGAQVRRGDLIARLDDRTLAAERRKAAAEVSRLDAVLTRLRHGARAEEIERRRAVAAGRKEHAEFAARELARYQRLVADGVAPTEKLDLARRDAALSRKALAEAEAELRLTLAGTRPEELDAARFELDRARAELDYLDERLRQTEIRAPIAGRVLTPRLRERLGESVAAGGVVCEIAGTDVMRAEIFVPEREGDAVRAGMPTQVKVESYPDRAFRGEVRLIAAAVERQDDLAYLRVVTELDNRDGLLKQGMSGYAEVDVGSSNLLALATRRLTRWIHVRFLL